MESKPIFSKTSLLKQRKPEVGSLTFTPSINLIKLMLGVTVKDPTSGFRCFKREVLENIGLDSMISTGQWIVSEVLYKVHLQGYKIGEIPIVFIDRTQGETKLNLKALFQSLYMVYKFRRTFR